MTPASRKSALGGAAPLGAAALLFSALYFLSDAIEALQGGFSTAQLLLTLVAEAAVPAIVIGLALAQRPALGRLGTGGALAYAAAYVLFVPTVIYALAETVPDYETLSSDLSALMLAGGALMVLGGIALGIATWRARVLPRWSGALLALGVVLVAATQNGPEGLQLLAAGARDGALAWMGLALLSGARPRAGAAAVRWQPSS